MRVEVGGGGAERVNGREIRYAPKEVYCYSLFVCVRRFIAIHRIHYLRIVDRVQ